MSFEVGRARQAVLLEERRRAPYIRAMPHTSISFDDDGDEPLAVFSGNDLLLSHYDEIDLDWHEVAERTALDERRGLVVLQVGVIEDLLDEFIHYLEDSEDQEALQTALERQTIGPRIDRFERLLRDALILDAVAASHLNALRRVVNRRNLLTHGTIEMRPAGGWPKLPLPPDLELEWVIYDRRSHSRERLTMSGLRVDLYDAIGLFTGLLSFAEEFVKVAPQPMNFRGGHYLAAPTP